MAYKNLRMLYDNVADSATITASTTAGTYTVDNVKSDIKGLVHRSTTTTSTYTLTWASPKAVSAVILPFTNLTSSATISIGFYSTSASATPLYTYSGSVKNFATVSPLLDINASQALKYSFGGGRCVSVWSDNWVLSEYSVGKLEITITDSTNTDGYIEVSRILCGTYWTPAYNTKFGIQVGYNDSTEQVRTDAGNLISNNKPIFKTISLELGWLTPSEKTIFINMVKTLGTRRPFFLSVFPGDADVSRENLYEIYGKFSSSPMLTYQMFTVYSTSIQVDEI